MVVPLVAILLVLSAWPDAISGHSFGGGSGGVQVSSTLGVKEASPVIDKPHVDWFALSPIALDDRARRGCSCSSPSSAEALAHARPRRSSAAPASWPAFVFAILVADKSPNGGADRRRLDLPRPLGRASRRSSIAGCGARRRADRLRRAMREEHIAEYYALLAAAGAGMAFFVQAANLMTLFLGLEWFSIALYVMCAIDIDLVGSLEAGLKYLIVGAVGSATLLFGSALVYGATGELQLRQDRRRREHARLAARARPRDDDRRASRSRPRRRRSTCGRPTPTRARRRR